MSTSFSTVIGEPVRLGPRQAAGVFYAPRASTGAGVLLLSPLFEEKRCAHHLLADTARAFADAGASALHLDLTATGNSPGDLTQTSLPQWYEDITQAAAYLRDHGARRLIVLACRAGALLALQITRDLQPDRLVLLQPVLDGAAYLQQTRTRRRVQDALTGEAPRVDAHEVEGERLSAALHEALGGLRAPDDPCVADLRLLQCSFNEQLLKEYQALAARWPALRARCLIAPPFWRPHAPSDDTALVQTMVAEVLS